MKTPVTIILLLLIFGISFYACSHPEKPDDKGEVFHAGPSSGGIGGLYFVLNNDHKYQICISGGIGQDCYSGAFSLSRDTLILNKLRQEIPLKSNRLIIVRFAEQDSAFWKWKYEESIGGSTWQDFRSSDLAVGGLGDVYQLNDKNELLRDDLHFTIRLDRLRNYR